MRQRQFQQIRRAVYPGGAGGADPEGYGRYPQRAGGLLPGAAGRLCPPAPGAAEAPQGGGNCSGPGHRQGHRAFEADQQRRADQFPTAERRRHTRQALRLDAGGYEALRRLFRQRRPLDLGCPVRIEAAEAGCQQQRLRSGAERGCSLLLPHQRRPVSGGQDHPLLRPAVRHHLRHPYFRHRGPYPRLYR